MELSLIGFGFLLGIELLLLGSYWCSLCGGVPELEVGECRGIPDKFCTHLIYRVTTILEIREISWEKSGKVKKGLNQSRKSQGI